MQPVMFIFSTRLSPLSGDRSLRAVHSKRETDRRFELASMVDIAERVRQRSHVIVCKLLGNSGRAVRAKHEVRVRSRRRASEDKEDIPATREG